jgi:hypothetical protein
MYFEVKADGTPEHAPLPLLELFAAIAMADYAKAKSTLAMPSGARYLQTLLRYKNTPDCSSQVPAALDCQGHSLT